MCTGSVGVPAGSHAGMLASRCHLSRECSGALQRKDKHRLTHTHADRQLSLLSGLHHDSEFSSHFPLSSVPLIFLPLPKKPRPLSSGLSSLQRRAGSSEGVNGPPARGGAGPRGGHHGVGLKAPSTVLIATACGLSNWNREPLSWKPALDVVQISESLPSPHLGYFPFFHVFPPRLLLLV